MSESQDGDRLATAVLQYETTEDITQRGQEPDYYRYFTCPECGTTVAEWCDCPECLWYDGDVWERTMAEAPEVPQS